MSEENKTESIHIWTHTGEKSFVCTICDKTFAMKDLLLYRWQTVESHQINCVRCWFEDSISLWIRKLNTTLRVSHRDIPLSFKLCLWVFNMKDKLIRIMLIRSGEKPFVCSKCVAYADFVTSINFSSFDFGSWQWTLGLKKREQTKTIILFWNWYYTYRVSSSFNFEMSWCDGWKPCF